MNKKAETSRTFNPVRSYKMATCMLMMASLHKIYVKSAPESEKPKN